MLSIQWMSSLYTSLLFSSRSPWHKAKSGLQKLRIIEGSKRLYIQVKKLTMSFTKSLWVFSPTRHFSCKSNSWFLMKTPCSERSSEGSKRSRGRTQINCSKRAKEWARRNRFTKGSWESEKNCWANSPMKLITWSRKKMFTRTDFNALWETP